MFALVLASLLPALVAGVDPKVGVVGLGQMGKAIVECYASHGYQVHAWNRGKEKAQVVKDLGLENVKVHDKLEEVLSSTDLVIMAILGGEDLKTAEAVVKSVPKKSWKGKTLMQYSAHEPTSANSFDKTIQSLGAKHIAGAMLAMPEDICHEGVMIIASKELSTIDKHRSTLEKMGPLVELEEDVGLASLVDIGVLQTVYFGIMGHEMTHLMIERYGAPKWFEERYLKIVTEVGPAWLPVICKQVSHVITTKKWKESIDSVELIVDVFQVHLAFFEKMGIVSDTYLHFYLKYVNKVADKKDACSRWIEHAIAGPRKDHEL